MNYSVIIGFITFLIFVSFSIYKYDGDFDPTNNYISDLSKDGQTSKDYFQLSIVFLMLFILAYVVSWSYRDPLDMTQLRIPFIVGSFFLISAFLFTRPHNDFIHLSMIGISAAMFSYMMYKGNSNYSKEFNQVSKFILPLFLAGLVVSYDYRPIYEWLSFGLLFIWISWWNFSNEKLLDSSPPVVCKFMKQR
jgi:hypothetical membrane protein